MTRIVIVDDHPVYRRGLAFLLTTAGHEIVGEAASGTEALAVVARCHPELVILDLGLPELHGTRVAGALRAERPDLAIVIVTMFEDAATVEEAMSAGADAYLVKDSAPDLILAAIAAVAQGATVFSPGIRRSASDAPARSGLDRWGFTAREREVADLLTHGLLNRTIAARLGINEKTVANYIVAVRMKLGATDRHDAARILREANP